MNEILTINNYPTGWSWLKSVPLEDFTWLIEVFSTMTDNIDTYNYCQYNNRKLIHVDTKGLAHFLCNDQGYEAGIKEYGYYIAAKSLDIKYPYRNENPTTNPSNPIYLVIINLQG